MPTSQQEADRPLGHGSCFIQHCSTKGNASKTCHRRGPARTSSRALTIRALPALYPITRVLQGGKRSCQPATACPPPLPKMVLIPLTTKHLQERSWRARKKQRVSEETRLLYSTATSTGQSTTEGFHPQKHHLEGKKSNNQERKKPIQTHTLLYPAHEKFTHLTTSFIY